jgi:riboflavin kinase/FMN adenylyltransferase
MLEQCGVDCTLVYPTDQALLDLTPRLFFDEIVLGKLSARGLVEGPNFRFGHDRAGDIDLLSSFCSAAGLVLDVVPPLEIRGLLVSSTEIRRLVQAGDVRSASELLDGPYRLRGRVARGAERGRTLGFPTANLEQVGTVLPRDGVYAGRVCVDDVWYGAGINVGPNPTFAEQSHKFEVHLIDFQGNLYDRWLDVELLDRLRDTTPFAGLDALRQQLQRDIARAREIAAARSQAVGL